MAYSMSPITRSVVKTLVSITMGKRIAKSFGYIRDYSKDEIDEIGRA